MSYQIFDPMSRGQITLAKPRSSSTTTDMAKGENMAKEKSVDSHYEAPGTCHLDHEGVPLEQLAALCTRQSGPARHRCPCCAYELGVKEGLRRARAEKKKKKSKRKTAATTKMATVEVS